MMNDALIERENFICEINQLKKKVDEYEQLVKGKKGMKDLLKERDELKERCRQYEQAVEDKTGHTEEQK